MFLAIQMVERQSRERTELLVVTKKLHALGNEGVLQFLRLLNQTVLLKGVNDNPNVLGSLLSGLTGLGVIPYYVFQCRPVKGVKGRFQVPLRIGAQIVDGAKAMQNGFGKAVRYCMSHPLGKIEILGAMANGNMLFKFHQNKYRRDESRIFTRRISDTDTWLDEDLEGI